MKDKRPFVVSYETLKVGTLHTGQVGIGIIGLGRELDIAAGIEVVLALSPDEARQLATSLIDRAAEVDGSGSSSSH